MLERSETAIMTPKAPRTGFSLTPNRSEFSKKNPARATRTGTRTAAQGVKGWTDQGKAILSRPRSAADKPITTVRLRAAMATPKYCSGRGQPRKSSFPVQVMAAKIAKKQTRKTRDRNPAIKKSYRLTLRDTKRNMKRI